MISRYQIQKEMKFVTEMLTCVCVCGTALLYDYDIVKFWITNRGLPIAGN